MSETLTGGVIYSGLKDIVSQHSKLKRGLWEFSQDVNLTQIHNFTRWYYISKFDADGKVYLNGTLKINNESIFISIKLVTNLSTASLIQTVETSDYITDIVTAIDQTSGIKFVLLRIRSELPLLNISFSGEYSYVDNYGNFAPFENQFTSESVISTRYVLQDSGNVDIYRKSQLSSVIQNNRLYSPTEIDTFLAAKQNNILTTNGSYAIRISPEYDTSPLMFETFRTPYSYPIGINNNLLYPTFNNFMNVNLEIGLNQVNFKVLIYNNSITDWVLYDMNFICMVENSGDYNFNNQLLLNSKILFKGTNTSLYESYVGVTRLEADNTMVKFWVHGLQQVKAKLFFESSYVDDKIELVKNDFALIPDPTSATFWKKMTIDA
jgi:hypothetical protein